MNKKKASSLTHSLFFHLFLLSLLFPLLSLLSNKMFFKKLTNLLLLILYTSLLLLVANSHIFNTKVALHLELAETDKPIHRSIRLQQVLVQTQGQPIRTQKITLGAGKWISTIISPTYNILIYWTSTQLDAHTSSDNTNEGNPTQANSPIQDSSSNRLNMHPGMFKTLWCCARHSTSPLT